MPRTDCQVAAQEILPVRTQPMDATRPVAAVRFRPYLPRTEDVWT
jgi:hypothetical protein